MLEEVKEIRIEDFDYALPDEQIPRFPMTQRDACRLLLHSPEGRIYHRIFKELPDLIPPGALMICNETKVIKARLPFKKTTGANIEIFLLEPVEPADYALNFQSKRGVKWKCIVGNLKKWKEGSLISEIQMNNEGKLLLSAIKCDSPESGEVTVEFSWPDENLSFSEIIELAGKIPIPPYLNRDSSESDNQDYQTMYARLEGSVAAPTAGLHFTPAVFEALKAHGAEIGKLTLHVGAGTFKPVKSSEIGGHEMHSERWSVSLELLEKIYNMKREGRPLIAVGTTSVRTLETLPYFGEILIREGKIPDHLDQWHAYDANFNTFNTLDALDGLIEEMKARKMDELSGSTSIMIAPGFKWRLVDGMVTNFHQPQSTLLLLVSSFLGRRSGNYSEWKEIYGEALKEKYRFLSYGDACLLL